MGGLDYQFDTYEDEVEFYRLYGIFREFGIELHPGMFKYHYKVGNMVHVCPRSVLDGMSREKLVERIVADTFGV